MTEEYLYDGGNFSSRHKVAVIWSKTGSKRKLEISVSAGSDVDGHHIEIDQAARLWGTIEGTTACLEHMEAGRFPPQRGVGYFMIHRFAEDMIKYCNPGPNVCLGSPVNRQSVNKAKEKGEKVSGEEAALHIYELCGFNVQTADVATTSQVTAKDLLARLAPKIKRWSELHDVQL